MELIRRNSDYALRSLVYMAKFPRGKKFTIKTIAKEKKIPVAFLRKIFQHLSYRKIVSSQRGPNGGFYLLKNPSQISLKDVLESVQGRISLSDCLFDVNSCNRKDNCEINSGLFDIQQRLTDLLKGYTLEDLQN